MKIEDKEIFYLSKYEGVHIREGMKFHGRKASYPVILEEEKLGRINERYVTRKGTSFERLGVAEHDSVYIRDYYFVAFLLLDKQEYTDFCMRQVKKTVERIVQEGKLKPIESMLSDITLEFSSLSFPPSFYDEQTELLQQEIAPILRKAAIEIINEMTDVERLNKYSPSGSLGKIAHERLLHILEETEDVRGLLKQASRHSHIRTRMCDYLSYFSSEDIEKSKNLQDLVEGLSLHEDVLVYLIAIKILEAKQDWEGICRAVGKKRPKGYSSRFSEEIYEIAERKELESLEKIDDVGVLRGIAKSEGIMDSVRNAAELRAIDIQKRSRKSLAGDETMSKPDSKFLKGPKSGGPKGKTKLRR